MTQFINEHPYLTFFMVMAALETIVKISLAKILTGEKK